MASQKKKSTTYSRLPDGSYIKEYSTEHTHPNGTKTITTTQVKTYKITKTLDDGSQITENISSTTTTTKDVSAPNQPDLFTKGMNNILDLFGAQNSKEGIRGEADYDAALTNELSRGDNGTIGAKIERSRSGGGRSRGRGRRREIEDDDDDGISTLGDDISLALSIAEQRGLLDENGGRRQQRHVKQQQQQQRQQRSRSRSNKGSRKPTAPTIWDSQPNIHQVDDYERPPTPNQQRQSQQQRQQSQRINGQRIAANRAATTAVQPPCTNHD